MWHMDYEVVAPSDHGNKVVGPNGTRFDLVSTRLGPVDIQVEFAAARDELFATRVGWVVEQNVFSIAKVV